LATLIPPMRGSGVCGNRWVCFVKTRCANVRALQSNSSSTWRSMQRECCPRFGARLNHPWLRDVCCGCGVDAELAAGIKKTEAAQFTRVRMRLTCARSALQYFLAASVAALTVTPPTFAGNSPVPKRE